MAIRLKHVQDDPAAEDGLRVWVDRTWPRGVKKVGAPVDEWALNLAPSEELAAWFRAEPREWNEFKQRYFQELAAHDKVDPLVQLAKRASQGTVTLLYVGRDEKNTVAAALSEFVRLRFSP